MLNYNCPKIPSPKKIKEGIKNFLKIYPQYTNYYNNLYNSKNLAGQPKYLDKYIFWPKCHTIKVYSNYKESMTYAMCEYFRQWLDGTSLKFEIVKEQSKADLSIKLGYIKGSPYAGYVETHGILNSGNKPNGYNCVINYDQDVLLQVFTNTLSTYDYSGGTTGYRKSGKNFNQPFIECTLFHEFGHFLGFYHEHSRSDRPWTYDIKKLNEDLRDPKIAKNLAFKGDYNDIKGQILDSNAMWYASAYDFKSIMQYDLSDMRNYIICNKGVNCEDLFKENNVLSDADKSFCKKIYGVAKDCPPVPPPPPIGPKKCEELQEELEKLNKIDDNLTEIIGTAKEELNKEKNKFYKEKNNPEVHAKHEININKQTKNLLTLELERFNNQYEIKKLRYRMEKGKCLIKNTEKPKTENCEFLVNLEETIKSLLSYAAYIKEKIENILRNDKKQVKINKLNNFLESPYKDNTYEIINSLIEKLNGLKSYKLSKKQESLIKEVKNNFLKISKNKTKGFSPVEPQDSFFSDLQIALNNDNINKINKILSGRATDLGSSIKELDSLMPIIPELKIKYCPTTTPRPITTPQSTSTPRPVFVSKS